VNRRTHTYAFLTLCASLSALDAVAQTPPSNGPLLLDPNPAPATLHVTLPEAAGGTVPQASAFNSFGCTGQNQSPHITWTGAPAGTRSFALIVHDPDAPTGVGFFHWTVFNIPATTTSFALDASHSGLPGGAVQGGTDFGAQAYGGPCPPAGENHRYMFTVYALDVPQLQVPPNATGAMLRFAVRGHTLALGRATATYRRP
jgi:Raf kinase inhibitor-like YbhB/YbcL family protein